MSKLVLLVEEHELCASCVCNVKAYKKPVRRNRGYSFYSIDDQIKEVKKTWLDTPGINTILQRRVKNNVEKIVVDERKLCPVCKNEEGLYEIRDSKNLCATHRKELVQTMYKTIINRCEEA